MRVNQLWRWIWAREYHSVGVAWIVRLDLGKCSLGCELDLRDSILNAGFGPIEYSLSWNRDDGSRS